MTTTPNATPNYDALLQAASAILDAPSTDIEHVFDVAGQLTKAAAAQRRAADEATAKTVDPRTKSADLAAAVAAAEVAKLDATRLEITAQRVEEKHLELVERANAAILADQYDHAEAESRRVADRIKREYPGLLAAHLDLIGDIMKTQEVVWAANRHRPTGKKAITGPEGLARGFPDHGPGDGSLQSLNAIRLTAAVLADPTHPTRPAWPPVLDWQFQAEARLMPYASVRAAWAPLNKKNGDE